MRAAYQRAGARPTVWLRLSTAITLLFATVGVSLLGGTPPAQARCLGVGSPYSIRFYAADGSLAAQETVQYASTCDGDSQFRDKVQDAKTDGHCAYVLMWDPGQAVIGSECTTGAWSNFTGWDQQGDSSALMLLCLRSDCSDVVPNFAFHTWGF